VLFTVSHTIIVLFLFRQTNRETMNSYFSTLDTIVNKRKISNRIRFMIQDVVDLRKTGWKPRREDNNPKTIDQIHREVHKEREEQERELNNPQFQGPMGSMGSRDGRMGDRRGGDDRNRKQSRKLTFFILYRFERE
jgi:translation initiation factor 4G